MGSSESSSSKMAEDSLPCDFRSASKFPVIPRESLAPVSESSDEGSDVDNQLDLLKSGDQSDVTLVCGGQHFLGHTHIISARSDVFRAMFRDLKGRTLTLDDVSPNTFRIVLDYMYSGMVPGISLETALKVYEAADMYEMQSLKNTCRRIIKKKIKEANAAMVLVFASKQNANDLKDIAVTYLARRKKYLLSENWRRFCENHPRLANDVFIAFVRRAE